MKNPTIYQLLVKYLMEVNINGFDDVDIDDEEKFTPTWSVFSNTHGGVWHYGTTLKEAVYACAKSCGEKLK